MTIRFKLNNMKTVNSVSGGQTSAYIAANYPADYNVFALVRIEDERCRFPDEKIRLEVEDRIQAPFIATAEDDLIIYTMLDLEQFIGSRIDWVTGMTFEQVIKRKGNRLPNKVERWCTTQMKMDPIFYWWAAKIGEPVEMRIGFRANEAERANTMLAKVNPETGLQSYKATFEKRRDGRNKWVETDWRRPAFPLIDDNIYKIDVQNYWQGKPVRFAPLNNCVGCFHRNPLLLRKMFDAHPEKMQWFADQEGGKKGTWRSDVSYETIKGHRMQFELDFSDFSGCDSGFCEVA